MQTERASVKVRNLTANGKVAVAIYIGIPLFDDRVRCVVEVTAERLIFW